jgi:hypothetical protein
MSLKKELEPELRDISGGNLSRVVNGLVRGRPKALFMAVRNTAFGEVVGGHFEGDAIAGEYSYAVSSQLAREVGENDPLLIQLNAKQAAGKLFNDGACNFNAVFFAHLPPSGMCGGLRFTSLSIPETRRLAPGF